MVLCHLPDCVKFMTEDMIIDNYIVILSTEIEVYSTLNSLSPAKFDNLFSDIANTCSLRCLRGPLKARKLWALIDMKLCHTSPTSRNSNK